MFNILVVEDDINTQKLICALLKKGGYNAFPAKDGVDALAMMETHGFDLIVLDLMMPRMDGYEICKELRDATDDIPILMITAQQEIEKKHKGFVVGTDDYMTKPFDEQELLFRLKALLRRAKIVNEHRLSLGDTILDYSTLTVTCGGQTTKVELKRVGEYARFRLHDNGCGMSENEVKHIFERFYQSDSSRSISGNGLGLALVYRIVTLCEGRIEVDSILGKGSIFTVFLPLERR